MSAVVDLDAWWADEIFKMAKSIPVEDRRRYVWRVDPATWNLIRSLKWAGGTEYLWQPAWSADVEETLIGRPVEVTDEVKGLVCEVRS